jgi:hypothetical protein
MILAHFLGKKNWANGRSAIGAASGLSDVSALGNVSLRRQLFAG